MSDEPPTRASVSRDLRALGVRPGDTVVVHSALSSLGWVCGGAVAVVQALLDALGPPGTLVAPTHTGENSDPARWTNPPVPESWWPVIREHMPPFDPRLTPTYRLGVIPEMVRTWPGAVRSNHPHTSFVAVGPDAGTLMADHRLDCQLGEHSPLAALERADAKVLLLGVGYGSCTMFHLAEYRLADSPTVEFGAAVLAPGGRSWVTYTDVDINSDDFGELGDAFEQTAAVALGQVGQANCRLFGAREATTFAVDWLSTHRTVSRAG